MEIGFAAVLTTGLRYPYRHKTDFHVLSTEGFDEWQQSDYNKTDITKEQML